MQFAIIATDKPNSEQIRDRLRSRRLEWLTANQKRIAATGGLVDDNNRHVNGGLMIVDAANRAEVEKFAAEDPFTAAGLYQKVEIIRWRKVYWEYGRITTHDPFTPD